MLDDKYTLAQGRVFLTGTQALVRLPMMQRQRDLANGLNTAGFISGYRGSPLGGVDQQLWRAGDLLEQHKVHFQPGINEDLAATAVWGSQQNDLFGDCRYDGVFALWYAKGPGVDRSGDVLRHGNLAGAAKHGGVLLVAGDDHAAKSSTAAHQCDYTFMDAMIPVLAPAGVQEFLDLGLYGWAMSRYSGCWIGFKCVTETVESTASVAVHPERVRIVLPEDFEMPFGGLNIRLDGPLNIIDQEERLHRHRLYAALAFARANRLNRPVLGAARPSLGIVTAGKSYLDVRQAFDDLGIDQAVAEQLGLAIYKVAMTWPLEPQGVRAFCEGLDEVLVIEEKRAVIENQLKEQLYNWHTDKRPRLTGKFDRDYPDQPAEPQLPAYGELSPARIARAIAELLRRHDRTTERIEERLAFLDRKEQALNREEMSLRRVPHFCSGCPHNTSTKVPEGSRALAGIGCHYMVQWMDRETYTFSQMGGEGVPWIGQAPFSTTRHVFVNLGDGTYYHSGLLAIRASVAAQVNITYKILYNDAVAMTGGQAVDGPLDPAMITRQVYGEGVRRIVVVTDEPYKYPVGTDWAPGVTIEHRSQLDRIQRELREIDGVSLLLYDQTCAAEKRRRRKRGSYPDPQVRAFINEQVCEGCGDCSVKSNCLSVVPLETELGTKRAIDQSACNKDFSCVDGFCPSFVTVHGGRLRKAGSVPGDLAGGDRAETDWPELPAPSLPALDQPYGILVTGVGGTGVVTIGALLGMAAHLEGKGCTILDMTGLAQKFGAVLSHVRIAEHPESLHAVRASAGGANLVLGCDLVVAASFDARSKMRTDETRAIVNLQETVTSDFTRASVHYDFHGETLTRSIAEATGPDHSEFLDASRIATALLGDSIATNLFMLGYAWQKGFVPLSHEAIERAVELNGVAVAFNTQAFLWGRRAAHDLAAVEALVRPTTTEQSPPMSDDLDSLIARRHALLVDYQDRAYAERYSQLVEAVRQAEMNLAPGRSGLAEAVARNAFKLMAYKDEYEVARLYAAPEFQAKLARRFEGDYKLRFHLAPPLLASRDPASGELQKRSYGAWMLRAFRVLAKLKGLRGSPFDIFGYSAERRGERRLIEDYAALLDELCRRLDQETHTLAVELAELPDEIRGFGHVKAANIARVKAREAELLTALRKRPAPTAAAE
jgi:indolepyruvate ferredoxin oxidoreductase